MKALKALACTLFAILLVLSAILLQANIALNNTVLSDGYFAGQFDKNIQQEDLEKLASSLTDNAEVFMPLSQADRKALASGKASAALKSQVNQFRSVLKSSIDEQWLSTEAPNLVKGTFSFLVGRGEALPTVGIKPLKNALVELFAGQFASQSGLGIDEFEGMVSQLESIPGGILNKSGKVNAAASSQLVAFGKVMGLEMKRETADKILLKIGNRGKDGTSSQQLYDFTARTLAGDVLGTSGMKNSLDLNAVIVGAYRSEENPVSGFPVMFKDLRDSFLLLNIIVFALLLCVIAVITFRPADILRWTGVPLIIAGAAGLLPAVIVALSNQQISALFAGLSAQGSQMDLAFLREWALSYAGGIALFLLIQSVVFILVGAGLLLGAHYIDRGKPSSRPSASRTGNTGTTAIRVVAALVLVAAIPLSAWVIGKNVMKNVDAYDAVMKQSQTQKGTPNFGDAFMKALGVKTK